MMPSPLENTENPLDEAWARLERLVDWSRSFYLAFIFSSSPEAVGILRERARGVLDKSGRTLRVIQPETPADVLAVVAAIAQPVSKTAHCFWVDTVAVDSADPTYALWREGYDQLILRLNESRQGLRTHLGGGLVLALPHWYKDHLATAASDLWSIRTLTIDLPGIPVQTPLAPVNMADFVMPPIRLDEGPTLDPDMCKDQARRFAGRGPGARDAVIANLLRASEGYLDRDRAAESLGMATEAEVLLRGVAPNLVGPDHATALAAMAAAEEALGKWDEGAEHVARAIELRAGNEERDNLWMYAIAERIALRREDLRAARDAVEGALHVAQSRHVAQPKDVEATNDLLAILARVVPLRRALGDMDGARAAGDEALVLRGPTPQTSITRVEAVRPSATLPPIVERLPAGEEGEREFKDLLNRLLNSRIIASTTSPPSPLSNFAPTALRGEGEPDKPRRSFSPLHAAMFSSAALENGLGGEVFWSPSDIRTDVGDARITRIAQKAASVHAGPGEISTVEKWTIALFFPRDLSQDEIEWLHELPKPDAIDFDIRGMSHLEKLLRPIPSLFARYYPELAAGHLPGFTPFDFRAFAETYRADFTNEKQFVHLLGFPPDALREKDARAHIRLADLFVPTVFRASDKPDERATLAPLLKDERSVLVLGDPGMGKTMLLTFVALLHADPLAQLDGFSPAPRRIPFFVSLREYALDDANQSLVEYLAKRCRQRNATSQAHAAFFEATLRMGEAIVLLDGLDEVGSSTARKRMADRVRELRQTYPDCPIWVTSRIHGYTHDIALPANEFAHVRIGPLDDTQVDDFLTRWYAIQSRDDGSHAMRKASLREAIFRTPQVRGLAQNPLLLTLMAFVHRFLGHLPQDRGELYEQCVNMLLRSWLEARERPEKHAYECFALSKDIPRSYLEALALNVQESGAIRKADAAEVRGLFLRDDALEYLTTYHVDSDRREPKITPTLAREEMRAFLDYACDRVGLLVDRGGGQLSFLHLSFQEYLAAACGTLATTFRDHERVFLDHYDDPNWSEVLLLRLYLFARKRDRAGLKIFDELIAALMHTLESHDGLTGWLLLGRALRDRQDVRPHQRALILRRLVRAFADKPSYETDVFVVFTDIRDFATPDVRDELRAACGQVQADGTPAEAMGALYAEHKLFGAVDGAVKRLGARNDLDALLPDVVAFFEVPEIAEWLARVSTPEHWEAAFSAWDAEDVYRLTLGWATGVVPCPVRSDAPLLGAVRWLRRKINAEVASRETFAKRYEGAAYAALFERPGTLHWEDVEKLYGIDAPLGFAVCWPALRVDVGLEPSALMHMTNLARERVSVCVGDTHFDEALTDFMTRFVGEIVRSVPLLSTWPVDLPQTVADAFVCDIVRSFGRDIVRLFRRAFGRDFVRPFVRSFDILFGRSFRRDFGSSFGRDFGSTMVRSLRSSFVRSFGDAFGRDFGSTMVRSFGASFGRDFIYDFRRRDPDLVLDIGVDPASPNWKEEWGTALDDDNHVQRILDSRAFWNAICSRGHESELEPIVARRTFGTNVPNPLALPLALIDFGSIAAMDWFLIVGRDLRLRYPKGDFPDDVWAEAFATNPISGFWAALSWNEHALRFTEHHGKLDSTLGALALAHADYASLMTGCDLEDADKYPAWKHRVDTAGPDTIHALRHLASVPVSVPATTTTPNPASAPAPVKMVPAEPAPLFTFLHLSDLHFGLPKAGDRKNQDIVLAALQDEFTRLSRSNLPRPDAVFITGDIAFGGKASEYADASKWLDALLKTLGLAADRVFVVPGNHDVDRSVDEDRNVKRLVRGLRADDDLDDALANDGDLALLLRRKEAYLDFATRFASACRTADKPPRGRWMWTFREQSRDNVAVHVIGLDTALLAAGNDDAKKLRLGQTQLALLKDAAPEREFVMVLGHHPLNKEWLVPDDETELGRLLRRRAHVYLAGHVHDHASTRIVTGGGSDMVQLVAGAAYGGREKDIPQGHAYSINAVLPPFEGKPYRLRIHPRRFSFQNGDFRTDVDNVLEGKTYADFDLRGIGH